MLKSLSTYLIVRGVLALIVGIVAVAWPGVTVYALVLLFGVCAFMDAVVQAVRAFSGLRAGAAKRTDLDRAGRRRGGCRRDRLPEHHRGRAGGDRRDLGDRVRRARAVRRIRHGRDRWNPGVVRRRRPG